MKLSANTLVFMVLTATLFAAPTKAEELNLSYTLSFEEAHAHYVDVEMRISGLDREYLDIKMAVWAPGSYLIREFSRNVEGFEAFAPAAGAAPLHSRKLNKNTWRVFPGEADEVLIQYRVYAFELSVRTSYINSDHAYLNGTSIFMYVDGALDLPSTIRVKPHASWKQISTGLEASKDDPFLLQAPNYDILADSPIEIGNQDIIRFEAAGIPHEVAVYGGGNYDRQKLAADFTRIIEECTSIFGENPCERYVFIVHFLPSGGGGLEHLNSTTLQFSRHAIETERGWADFLALAAHEYFHLWNVKRLRPAALGPFDYEQENYTSMLWMSEGFTAYYDNWIVRRTGFFSPEEYLRDLSGTIGTVENSPGNQVQPVAEASMDAWVKYYRPNENSYNTTVSYYSKGAILAMLLDLAIRERSGGRQDLDDLMRYLYGRFYKELGRGFTDEEFKEAAEKFAGNLDEFYERYVWGTAPVAYDDYLDAVGLRLEKSYPRRGEAHLGATLEQVGQGLLVTRIVRGTPAYTQGLSVNDLILSADGKAVSSAADLLSGKKPGDKLELRLVREGYERPLVLELGPNEAASYSFEKLERLSPQQQANYRDWLALNE